MSTTHEHWVNLPGVGVFQVRGSDFDEVKRKAAALAHSKGASEARIEARDGGPDVWVDAKRDPNPAPPPPPPESEEDREARITARLAELGTSVPPDGSLTARRIAALEAQNRDQAEQLATLREQAKLKNRGAA